MFSGKQLEEPGSVSVSCPFRVGVLMEPVDHHAPLSFLLLPSSRSSP